ncbi:MAG TPA: DUF192 domain-containing protein [Burkholderiaceae bacterium]|nr:DUF192 domain-containing protein [Burkholderiaceae bacterium]
MPHVFSFRQIFRTASFSLACAALVACAASAVHPTQAQAAPPARVVQLNAGMHLIHAELADTPDTRQQGLMHRQSLRPNSGMLFVFEEKAGHCFWMKNTPLPLTIAFLADNGTIVNLADMQPQSEQNHCPRAAVRYALEMQQGWFRERGITAGATIGGLPQPR